MDDLPDKINKDLAETFFNRVSNKFEKQIVDSTPDLNLSKMISSQP